MKSSTSALPASCAMEVSDPLREVTNIAAAANVTASR